MLTPRYYISNDFAAHWDYFLTQPHACVQYKKGNFLWNLGEPFGSIYYLESGIAQMYVMHEDGHKKIMSFHGTGTVAPGYHQTDFKIEQSIALVALTDLTALRFSKQAFATMFEENNALAKQVVESYSMNVNLLIYESAHQEYNNSFLKLCNFLYLFWSRLPNTSNRIELTQDEIGEILAMNRVGVASNLGILRSEGILKTHRRWIEVLDCDALKKYCSQETL